MIRCVGARNGMPRIGSNIMAHHPGFRPSQVVEAEQETVEEGYDKDDGSAGYPELSLFQNGNDEEEFGPPNLRADISVRQQRHLKSDFGFGDDARPVIETMSDPEQEVNHHQKFGDTPRYQESEYFNLFRGNRLEEHDFSPIHNQNVDKILRKSPSFKPDDAKSDKIPQRAGSRTPNKSRSQNKNPTEKFESEHRSNKTNTIAGQIKIQDFNGSEPELGSQEAPEDRVLSAEAQQIQVLSEDDGQRYK